MGGSDKIDIMAPYFLKMEHHACQVFISDALSFSLMGDRPVLAEDTTEIAVRKEDGTRPMATHQRYLLAKMGMGTENDGIDWSPTEPCFAFQPIYPALPRAKLAVFEHGVSLVYPRRKPAILLQPVIGWMPFISRCPLTLEDRGRKE